MTTPYPGGTENLNVGGVLQYQPSAVTAFFHINRLLKMITDCK